MDLQRFCHNDRPSLAQPWSRGDYTYATDGIIGVRVPRRADVPNEDGPDWEAMAAKFPAVTRLEPLPDIASIPDSPRCKTCNGLGYVIECSTCDGEGETECICCGSDVMCKQCHGAGTQPIPVLDGTPTIGRGGEGTETCSDCGGNGTSSREYVYVEVAPDYFLQGYVVRLLQSLPGVQIDAGAKLGQPMRFTFDGGDGIAMSLHPGSERHAGCVVRLRKPEAA